MIREIRYENSRGDSITFGGDHGPWRFGATDIFSLEQSYKSIGNTITSFNRGIQKRTLQVFMRSGTLEERNRFESILIYDSRVCEHGTLYAGDSYLKCYCLDVEKTDWHYFDGMLTATLTFVIDMPAWVRKATATLVQTSDTTAGGLDYPHDYPHDYLYSAGTTSLVMNPFLLPASCDIVFPGPCVSPYVIIGGNKHQVDATAEKGQLIIVRGFGKVPSIVLRSANGAERDIFARGIRDKDGHIFAKIPPGENVASWAGGYNIEISMYEEALSPWWT